jgi:organic hydroperoxide reductase OsmC/OhrA
MSRVHRYEATLNWTGAAKGPAENYAGYSRDYDVTIPGKPVIHGSADATFRGDPSRHNPEDLQVIALSACHMLTYLAVCTRGGIKVLSYEDHADGQMELLDGKVRFTRVTLRPRVVIDRTSDPQRAKELHEQAHEECFVANSVNFPVGHEAEIVVAE